MGNTYAFEEVGTCFVLEGVGYEVVSKLDDGQVTLKNLMTLQKSGVSTKVLRQQLFAGHLRFALAGKKNLREEAGTPLKTRYTFTDLGFLPKELQYETWLHYTIIEALLTLKPGERTKTEVNHRVAAVIAAYLQWVPPHDQEDILKRLGGKEWWKKYDLEFPPTPAQDVIVLMEDARQEGYPIPVFQGKRIGISERSVQRWIQQFRDSHGDICALAPASSERGPKHPVKMVPLAEELLKDTVADVFNTKERPTVQYVIAELNGQLAELNKTLPPEQRLDPFKKDTVYRAVARLDPYEVDSGRFGQAYAERKHQQFGWGPHPTRPNARWEIDHSPLDLLVIDEVDLLPIGRPILTLVTDKYSHYPPGFCLSFEPASYLTVMEALFYSMIEKDFVKPLLGLQHDYLPYGIPERLICDNGPEFNEKSRSLKTAGKQLHFEVDWMPRRTPWFKAAVERQYGATETELIHTIPGTTFSNFLQRGDYDPSRYACITLNGLWYLLHLWIVDIYAQSGLRSGRGSLRRNSQGVPAKLWERALEENFVPRLPPSREALLVLLGRTEMRPVHSYGIEFMHLYFNSHKLGTLRDQLHGEQVMFKYNPADLSRIWVMDPFSKTYLEVLAIDQEYTKGLSLWKHQVMIRFVKEELKRDVDEASLTEAKYRLHQLIREEFRLTQQVRTRKRMARFLNIQVIRFLRGMPDLQSPTDVHEIQLEEELAARSRITSTTHSVAAPRGEPPTPPEKAPIPIVSADLAAPLPSTVEGVTLAEPEKPVPAVAPLTESPVTVSAPTATPTTGRGRGRPRTTQTPPEQPQEPSPPAAPLELTAEQRARFGITVSFTKATPD